jgi:hypothetical protein
MGGKGRVAQIAGRSTVNFAPPSARFAAQTLARCAETNGLKMKEASKPEVLQATSIQAVWSAVPSRQTALSDDCVSLGPCSTFMLSHG